MDFFNNKYNFNFNKDMVNKKLERFEKRAVELNQDAVALMEYTLTFESLIDLFDGIYEGYQESLKKNGFIEKPNRQLNFFRKSLRELIKYQHSIFGNGRPAEVFADKNDSLQELILKLVLLPNEKIDQISSIIDIEYK